MALCLETGLSAALEMRDAYRSFQLEAFCVERATGRLRASAQIKGSFSALLTATYGSTSIVKCEGGWGMNKNKTQTHAACIFQRWWRLRFFVRFEQQQQINAKNSVCVCVCGGGIFFSPLLRINEGLIVIRDPITAFVPRLSPLQPMAGCE